MRQGEIERRQAERFVGTRSDGSAPALRGMTRIADLHALAARYVGFERADAVFAGRMPQHPTVYVSAPPDPTIAPEGHEAWFVLVNAPPHDPDGGTDWDAPGRRESYADHILEVMADRGVDVAGRIRHRRIISPADLERRTHTPGGSIYGTASNGASAAFLRPANRSPVPGLYLVGGSSHPGGGLPLVMMSAEIVTTMIGPATPPSGP